MGAFLDKPRTEKSSEKGEGLGLRYGVCSMQGWRTEMEDAHSSLIGLPFGFDDWSFFAVYDGHAGKKISALAADHLIKSIFVEGAYPRDIDPNAPPMEPKGWKKLCDDYKLKSYPFDPETEARLIKHFESNGDDYNRYKIDRKRAGESYETGEDGVHCVGPRHPELNETSLAFLRSLDWYLPSEADSIWMVKEAIRRGFLSLDERLRDLPEMRDGADRSGSTAVCAIISPEHIFLANCGDSRAIMCRNREVIFETQDHKPADSREKKRIVDAGGSVMIQRVNGSLAVSRALGDYEYKNNNGLGPCQQLVSPEPDVHAFRRSGWTDTKFSSQAMRYQVDPADPDFIVLACDGIWDVMSSVEVCHYVSYLLKIHDDLEQVCATVIDTCLHKGSRDNMTIVIILFREVKVNDQFVQADKKIDEMIVEYLEQNKPYYLSWPALSNRLVSHLEQAGLWYQTGGGIESKYKLIDDTMTRLRANRRDKDASEMNDSTPSSPPSMSSFPHRDDDEGIADSPTTNTENSSNSNNDEVVMNTEAESTSTTATIIAYNVLGSDDYDYCGTRSDDDQKPTTINDDNPDSVITQVPEGEAVATEKVKQISTASNCDDENKSIEE